LIITRSREVSEEIRALRARLFFSLVITVTSYKKTDAPQDKESPLRGPLPKGTLPRDIQLTRWEWAKQFGRGAIYRVTEEFTESDGCKHLPGETWRYICSYYSPYDGIFVIGIEINQQEYEIIFRDGDLVGYDTLESLHFKVEPVSW
jgi:hypothetical protein